MRRRPRKYIRQTESKARLHTRMYAQTHFLPIMLRFPPSRKATGTQQRQRRESKIKESKRNEQREISWAEGPREPASLSRTHAHTHARAKLDRRWLDEGAAAALASRGENTRARGGERESGRQSGRPRAGRPGPCVTLEAKVARLARSLARSARGRPTFLLPSFVLDLFHCCPASAILDVDRASIKCLYARGSLQPRGPRERLFHSINPRARTAADL